MSIDADQFPPSLTTVVVAIKGGGGGGLGGKGSRRAVRWAAEHLVPIYDRLVLVHVIPAITSVPTPSGDSIPIEELNANVVEMYVKEIKVKAEEIFIPFKKLCKTKKIETLVLESDNPASALLTYVTDFSIKSLVMGSSTSCFITRKLKANGLPSLVLKHAPEACEVYVVARHRLITTSNWTLHTRTTSVGSSGHWLLTKKECGSLKNHNLKPGLDSSSVSDASHSNSIAATQKSCLNDSNASQNRNYQNFGNALLRVLTVNRSPSVTSIDSKQSEVQAEVEKLRVELSNTVALYKQTCDDLVLAQNQVCMLSSECVEETRQVNEALKREESYRKIAAEEREKHLEAEKEVEMARQKLACESYERQIAELRALEESLEKQKIAHELFSNDRRYKRYSRDQIEMATNFFSEAKLIGEGSYGKVYRCSLDNISVAVKVIRSDALEKKEEFLKEIEVLCQLRHPHIVLLLGACPEIGCLVYEYMEKGSLEDHISNRSNRTSLPWFIRFKIIFEIACGLSFLHNSKPVPTIHRDLKPGNIFINQFHVSKIGDVGLAKLVSESVPDNVTEYRESVIAGTLYYMDPEYQRTGTVRPKSDLYAFGIIILQLLTGRHANGIIVKAENSLKKIGDFFNILDKSVVDWPLVEAEELARIGLKCARFRCRDRPDLDTEVLPVLRKLADMAEEASSRMGKRNVDAPRHYFCPILKEIMNDPHIAADGFTYEHRAIKVWLERHNVSPVTKVRLQHKLIIPNHTLHLAIQEWRSRTLPASVSNAD